MIHIGLCADENFSLPFGVCLTSIFEAHKDTEITVHVITQGFSATTLDKIKNTEVQYNKSGCVKIYNIDDSIFKDYPLSKQFPKSIYFRYLFASLLSGDIEKLIYIDSDTVVTQNLAELWDISLGDRYLLGAVEDRNSDDIIIRNRIGRWEGKYFNSGVLLMNLYLWRKENAFNELADFILRYPKICLYPDQDAINVIFYDYIKDLPYQYNFLISFIAPFETYRLHVSKKSEIEKAFKDLSIVHFAAEVKPWHKDSKHPLFFLWTYYYKISQWKNFKLSYRRSFIKRILSSILRKILYPGIGNSINTDMRNQLDKYIEKYCG